MSKIRLSDGEWKIMILLWESSPKTITQLVASLQAETGWSKHTLITMLGRLEKKGAVAHREGGRAKQYYPLIDRDKTALLETKTFLNKVYDGSLGFLLNEFIHQHALSPDEIQELSEILDKAKEETDD